MDEKQELYEFLLNSDCSKIKLNAVCECINNNDTKQLLAYLDEYRRDLLNKLHVCEKKLECLDYFYYRITKNESEL